MHLITNIEMFFAVMRIWKWIKQTKCPHQMYAIDLKFKV